MVIFHAGRSVRLSLVRLGVDNRIKPGEPFQMMVDWWDRVVLGLPPPQGGNWRETGNNCSGNLTLVGGRQSQVSWNLNGR